MVYVRTKRVKSDEYLYLVRSVWDPKKGTSRQEIVKYLGKASRVTRDDIPQEYRDDPKILASLSSHSPGDVKRRQDAARRSRNQLYAHLTGGNIRESMRIYDAYSGMSGTPDFFDRVLRPVMYRIGEDWKDGRISIATEHVASNMAQSLVKIIMERVKRRGSKKRIMICVPMGEEHHLGCDVLETYLTLRGFRVFNMRTPMPSESVLEFIGENKPDVVLMSITLPDNIPAGRRLAARIRTASDVPILVGGYAVQGDQPPEFQASIIRDADLESIPAIIRNAR